MKFKKNIKIQNILDFCGPLISETLGNLSQELFHFAPPHSKLEGGFAFIKDKRWLERIESSNNICVLAPHFLKEKIEEQELKRTWLFSKNVELTAQKIKKEFVFNTPYRCSFLKGKHPTAWVAETAKIHESVTLGPYAVVGENCLLGRGTYVASHVVIEENCQIGEDVTLHPHCYIGHSCKIGHRCEIMPQAVIGSEGYGYVQDSQGNHHRIPHTGSVVLEEEVHIGACTAIDRGVLEDSVIGCGTKIDNHCHLGHNITMGEKGLMTAQGGTGGSVIIGDHFVSGGRIIINSQVKITDNVHLAALSGVSRNIKDPGAYGGYPLEPLRKFLKTKASSVHVPQLRKEMKRVLKKLFYTNRV